MQHPQQLPFSRHKNACTYHEYSQESSKSKSFITKIISDSIHSGHPQLCPHNDHLHFLKAPGAKILSKTTYGGPGSKYKIINEDSFFYGVSFNESIISGVIDGSGGSQCGYLGGKIANETLSQELINDADLKESFLAADINVMNHANGGYASGVVMQILPSLKINLGSKGDARAVTIRNERILSKGTTSIQSQVADMIYSGELPSHSIHTHRNKHIISSVIGDQNLPVYQTEFQGKQGDRIILASDGMWDVITDFELQEMSKYLNVSQLQSSLYLLALHRNNTTKPFFIQFSKEDVHLIKPLFANGKKCKGDNITVQVVEIL